MHKFARVLAVASLIAAFGGTIARASDASPIIDAHLHYSQSSWGSYPPAKVIALMDEAGVSRAVTSSTPDDGTLMLYKLAPTRIVPFLRPYRGDVTPGNWVLDPTLSAYLEERLQRGIYKGIGEFHLLNAAMANTPNVHHVVELAVRQGLYLEVHSGAEPVHTLFAIDPQVNILWAHAGMSEPPAVVGEMLERYPRLCVEVSFRAGDIAPGGHLNGDWRTLFLRFPDRFLIGTDTYVTERLGSYVQLIGEHRTWLAQLPEDVAAKIAHQNAERILGPTN